MKKFLKLFLIVTIIFSSMFVEMPTASASSKDYEPKAIAIVFDNSGSMYDAGDKAWCRATYAMDVFASMLNEGDILQIYPMHPITIGDDEYTMEHPFQITDASQASTIREIYTKDAAGTPIESIDCAIKGLKHIDKTKKYLVVLTDGGTFSKNGHSLTKQRTKKELDKRFKDNANEKMNIMYLGIGSDACVPNTKQSDYFVKKQAVNTADVLSTLTDMCNLIFGRDTLPKSHISGNTIDIDISMKKMIVFVQGENISDLKLTSKSGDNIGAPIRAQDTKYSTKGAGDYKSVPDTSLQGMIVTYENCAPGTYDIDYSGTATSAEVYYEPNADLDFVFTDSNGKNVELDKLYEGDYKVSFGMKDAVTGQLISSDLLGDPHYEGSYTLNGENTTFNCDGNSGDVPITLNMNDTFEADLTVTYLSGYTISKDSSDFGWPNGGIRVIAPPLGKFKVKLDVPKDYILIKDMDTLEDITANITIDGEKLTSDEFAAVTVNVDCGGLPYTLTPNPEGSQYKIHLESRPGISEGDYRINVDAKYLDIAEREAQDEDHAKITLSNIARWLKILFVCLLLLLVLLVLFLISRIRVLPKRIHTSKASSSMNFDGDDVTKSTNFASEIKNKSVKVQSQYAGKKIGLMMDVKPGKESYLFKPQTRKSAEVKATSVRKFGSAKIQEATIGSVKYVLDEDSGKLVSALPDQKPFLLTNGTLVKYSGIIQDAGVDKDFEVTSKLNFKKK